MLDYLQKLHAEQLDKLQTRYKERADSGVETEGGYNNEISRLKRRIAEIDAEIKSILDATTPDNIQIFCYVIVSNKENVKNNIGEDYFSLLAEDRYDDAEIRHWKPFLSNDVILNILREFRKKTGYQFEEQYLDGELADEQWVDIDDHKKNSVVIIDLLSLYEQNKKIASHFDTEDVAGILTPSCRSLTKHDDIFTFIKEVQSEVFHVLEIKMKTSGCSLFESNIPEFDNFYQKLLQIFKRNFPIKNQIKTDSNVRGLSISLQ